MQPEQKIDTEPSPTDIDPAQTVMIRRRRVGAVMLLMVISILLTSTLLMIGGVLVFRNAEAHFWRHTIGVLLDAHIESHKGEKTPLPDVPVVKYEYDAAGKHYISDKWSPAGYGLDINESVRLLRSEHPLVVYYSPFAPADSAVILPPLSIGFLPFTLGLGLFLILVVAISGGMLYATLHPDDAVDPASKARKWIGKSLRVGLALTLSSLTGLITLSLHQPGGWWQWAIAAVAVGIAVRG